MNFDSLLALVRYAVTSKIRHNDVFSYCNFQVYQGDQLRPKHVNTQSVLGS